LIANFSVNLLGRGLNSVENLIADSIDRQFRNLRRSSRLGSRSKFKTEEVLDKVLDEVDDIANLFAMYAPQAPNMTLPLPYPSPRRVSTTGAPI